VLLKVCVLTLSLVNPPPRMVIALSESVKAAAVESKVRETMSCGLLTSGVVRTLPAKTMFAEPSFGGVLLGFQFCDADQKSLMPPPSHVLLAATGVAPPAAQAPMAHEITARRRAAHLPLPLLMFRST